MLTKNIATPHDCVDVTCGGEHQDDHYHDYDHRNDHDDAHHHDHDGYHDIMIIVSGQD